MARTALERSIRICLADIGGGLLQIEGGVSGTGCLEDFAVFAVALLMLVMFASDILEPAGPGSGSKFSS